MKFKQTLNIFQNFYCCKDKAFFREKHLFPHSFVLFYTFYIEKMCNFAENSQARMNILSKTKSQ